MTEEPQEVQPLEFCIPQPSLHDSDDDDSSFIRIKIHQATALEQSEHHDTGLVMWPSAVMLSRYITNHPSILLDQVGGGGGGDILELGAGCGLVGLVAATLLQQQRQEQTNDIHEKAEEPLITANSSNVIFTDYNPTARENLVRNALLNNLDKCTSVLGLDFFDQQVNNTDDHQEHETTTSTTTTKNKSTWTDMDGQPQPQVHLILAADIICYSNDAELVAATIQTALVEGGHAIVLGANEDRRFGVAYFEQACLELGLEVVVSTLRTDDSDNDNNAGGNSRDEQQQKKEDSERLAFDLEEQTSGFSGGYDFTMFTIDKPLSKKD